jgi:hypothetical protein
MRSRNAQFFELEPFVSRRAAAARVAALARKVCFLFQVTLFSVFKGAVSSFAPTR